MVNPVKARKFRTLLAKIVCPSLLFAGSVCSEQNPRPPVNYADFGACPFECCTYRRWSVVKDTVLYKSRSEKSGEAFRVRKGEHVIGLTGVVITLRPGKAIVNKTSILGDSQRRIRVKPGNVIYLLHYKGEGFYKFWFQSRIYQGEMPFAPDLVYQSPKQKAEQEARAGVRILSEPQTVWWVKVKNEKGRVGWSKQDENFGDMDACG